MPPLNWDVFEGLPGAADTNFEALCRALIRRHYGRYGHFATRAAQPGVEFHLRLHTACDLGEPGRWYGWQCRWWDLPGGRAVGANRRREIREAIDKTEQELLNLTDWVLWTRRPLTRGDQEWFHTLPTKMRLHLWTADEVEAHLSGDAAILRGSYFGEFIITPSSLYSLHAQAVAPIRRRWQPQVHQPVDAERALRRMLGGASTWDDLQQAADQLDTNAATVETDRADLSGPLDTDTAETVKLARTASSSLLQADAALERGDLDLLRQQLADNPAPPSPGLITLPRRLRAHCHRAALSVTSTLAHARLARTLLADAAASLGVGLVAVVADAGCGKTELAAQLTAADGDRPAGILLHGRDLHGGQNLDDLARGVVIQGKPVPSMEALLAAVDAAGQRAHRRLPLVIDGLNEAEDPRDWKSPLAALIPMLDRYAYVLVVCTVRGAFAGEALPDDLRQLEIPSFEGDTREAIRRYFNYYKIDPDDAELPIGLLGHPLTLRLFCEVANPTRAKPVGIEAIPRSLTAIFDRYLDQAGERIAEIAPRTHRYYEQDVRTALDEIGTALWEQNTRSLDMPDLRRRLSDEARPWNESIVRALEQDGVLSRVPGTSDDPSGSSRFQVLFDSLAGHVTATTILRRRGRTGLEQWLRDPETVTALAGPRPDQHPLADDTFAGLVGLVPRQLGQQLWPLVDEPLRTAALRGAADLEAAYLDGDTVEQLKVLAAQPPTATRDLFHRLLHTRGGPAHPLNAEFLDAVLRPMTVAERDARWTEWIRRNRDELQDDLRRQAQRWRTTSSLLPEDRLRARWVMWTLTSTVRSLRDHATQALYWFGRGDPAVLFDLTVDALDVNDPYVPERLLAAACGTTMAYQLPDPPFTDALASYLARLRDALTGPAATHPTSHWLARLYAQVTVSFALIHYPNAVPADLNTNGHFPFAPGPPVNPIPSDDPRAAEVDRTLRMDFRNYTLGRLFRARRNYDMRHVGHIDAVAHVLGTVWAMGWRETGLGAVDVTIPSDAPRYESARTERYGKKYGWIGFYTYAGYLNDKGQLQTDQMRLPEVDIDPSFPEPPRPAPITVPVWARATPTDERRWIRKGVINVPDELLWRPALGPHQGPWIAVHGHLNADEQSPRRRVFGLLTALLVPDGDADRLIEALRARPYPGNGWLPQDPPAVYYMFAGEIPSSPEFTSANSDDDTSARPYFHAISVENGPPVEVEILAHRYAWEDYHSALNRAGAALVPSKAFSAAFDLRGLPQTFDQASPDGNMAAVSLHAPTGFHGRLLYLREDLVHQYAAGRRLIWFAWGERQLHPPDFPLPRWLDSVYQEDAHIWRQIRRGEDLSLAFV